jgi:hypothetical protein
MERDIVGEGTGAGPGEKRTLSNARAAVAFGSSFESRGKGLKWDELDRPPGRPIIGTSAAKS